MITNLKINPELKREYYEKGYWTSKTLSDYWNERVEQYGSQELVSDDLGGHYTYAEVDDQAGRLASWLWAAGVRPGDVVTYQLPPWAEFCIVFVACLKVGAVSHPLSVTFNADDLIRSMNELGSKAFICPTFHHKTSFEEQILEVVDSIPSLTRRAVAVIDKQEPAQFAITLHEVADEYQPFEHEVETSSDDVTLILSTSGTTGRPKGVLHTHNALVFASQTFAKRLGLKHNDVIFMPAPLNHATGFKFGIITPILLGGRIVLQHEFYAPDALDLIESKGVTWSMGATPFVLDLFACADEQSRSFAAMKLYVCGGAPVPGTLVRVAHDHGILLCECYGSTESSPHVLVSPEHCLEWNGQWAGCACDGIETKIVDGLGAEVPAGVQGEEVSRGPQMFCGYFGNQQATDEDLSDDGWFKSGDLCTQDEQGRIRVTGRKKEILIRGGENISLNEVDERLSGCPGVGAHATIGMPDKRMGERICTFVVQDGPVVPTVASVSEYLDSIGVAKRLRPEHLEFIDAIPMTDSGKVKRNLLIDELKERLALR